MTKLHTILFEVFARTLLLLSIIIHSLVYITTYCIHTFGFFSKSTSPLTLLYDSANILFLFSFVEIYYFLFDYIFQLRFIYY